MGNSLFDTVNDRHNSDSAKFDLPSSTLPLTYADTDFLCSPKVVQAIKNRAEHGLFGYVKAMDGWKNSLIRFYEKRFGLSLEVGEIVFSTGVLAAVTAFVLEFASEGEEVIVNTPVYDCFFSCITHSGRTVKDVPLLHKNGKWSLDLKGLGKAMEKAKAMILCSPHNPVGIGFAKEELSALFDLAKKHRCVILSDEIHGLLSLDEPYLPSLCLDNAANVIMAASPSKAYNTAGIQAAFVASHNPDLLSRMEKRLGYDDCGEPNCFAQPVLQAAYEDEEYLDLLLEYLRNNRGYIQSRLKEDGRVSMEGPSYSYLGWIDCSSLVKDAMVLLPYLEREGLSLLPGLKYGRNGKTYLRLNFALPRVQLEEALDRFFRALDAFQTI